MEVCGGALWLRSCGPVAGDHAEKEQEQDQASQHGAQYFLPGERTSPAGPIT